MGNPNPVPTRATLLLQLRDARNAQAWEQFVEIYTPLIHYFCRQRGLQEADAADVAQEVMSSVAQAIRKFQYDPQRGRFRNWLLTIVRSKLSNFARQQRRKPEPASASSLQWMVDQQLNPPDATDWEREYFRRMFHWAAERIRTEFNESTWQAFWGTAIEARDGKEVAAALGLSVGAVYVAKSRVVARLKQEIRNVDEEGVAPPDFLIRPEKRVSL